MPFFTRRPGRHITRTDYALDDLDLTTNAFGHDLDQTPDRRYDVYWELGPQEANVTSARFTVGTGGIPEGATGDIPSPVGLPQDDTPVIGFMPALVDTTIGLKNEGVFEPVFANGAVSLQNPSYWYDGGLQEPFWQKPNNTSPQPVPWDQGLTVGFGTIETLSGLVG